MRIADLSYVIFVNGLPFLATWKVGFFSLPVIPAVTVAVEVRSLRALLPLFFEDSSKVTPSMGSMDSFSLILKLFSIYESAACAFFFGLNTLPVLARSDAHEIVAVSLDALPSVSLSS